jgi:hypothetical protein
MTVDLLKGPDGTNPLGFLCAIGLLRIVHEQTLSTAPRLSWRDEGYWHPVLHVPDGHPDPVHLVLEDLETWRNDRVALALSYAKERKHKEEHKANEVHDLKAPPDVFRAFMQRVFERVSPHNRRDADFAAAYGSDVVRDKTTKGNTKPTAFHFLAGNQAFLKIVSDLAAGITEAHIREALYGPWRYQDRLGVLRWDAAGERLHALMAAAPANVKPPGVAGADWLAFQALPFFPCFPLSPSRLATTGFESGDRAFIWPLWDVPITVPTLRSLLSDPKLANPDPHWQRARGVPCVWRAAVRHIAQGYGTFGAAELVPGR